MAATLDGVSAEAVPTDHDPDPDRAIEHLASAQCGVVARSQVIEHGMSVGQLRARVRQQRLRPVAPGVLSFPGHTDSFRRRCWIAVLHAGEAVALSHSTAGRLHRMAPMLVRPVELIVGRGHSRGLPDTLRHRPRGLPLARVERIDGLPVTPPARTIVDLAAQLRPGRLGEVIQHAEVEGICTVATVGAELARVRRRGVPGVRRLESVLDDLGPGDEVPRSELERVGDQVRRRAGLPDPIHEHPLPSASGRPGFVDRAWPEAMFITEYDGRRWHTRRSQMRLDHQRDLEAAALGWHALRLCWEQLSGDPDGTAELWRATYEHRRALLASRGPHADAARVPVG